MLGELDDSGKIVAKEVSIDNKPDDGRPASSNQGALFAVEYDDGVDEPARVAQTYGYSGASMSRSPRHSRALGRRHFRLYTVPLTSKTKTLIIGSDGLWEFISNQTRPDAKCPRNDHCCGGGDSRQRATSAGCARSRSSTTQQLPCLL